jgi:hypothetical protein
MKENQVDATSMDAKLRERLLLARAVPGDRLILADATLLAALDGGRALTPAERAALQQSPLTLRRFKQLALERRASALGAPAGKRPTAGKHAMVEQHGMAEQHAMAGASATTDEPAGGVTPVGWSALGAANDASWRGSGGMLRAAAGVAALEHMSTDDQYWTLHFLPNGAGQGWQVVLKLAAEAPFAPQLLRERPLLRVLDGAGAIVLQGVLDADGECECAWPFAAAPAPHFHQHGAGFVVEPAAP